MSGVEREPEVDIFEMWAVGCGLWAVGCGLWAMGYELWAIS
jgi:hypothetical protein